MNGHANIDTIEATEHLKNILNVGKSETDSAKLKAIANGSMEAAGEGHLLLHDQPYQKIDLCANKDGSYLTICGTDVDIYSSPLEYGATSSQVIVEDMVDYGWEDKYYTGKLISLHLSGHYLAYVLKPANNKPGYVRLLQTDLELRHLIKDYKNEVKDVAFAHSTSQVLLGSVDACGELLVHKIDDDKSVIFCNLLLRILRPSDWMPSEHNRIIWCLFIPDENENADEEILNDDVATLLVVTHNERAEIWNVDTIIKQHGRGNLTIDEVMVGVQVISDHKTPISSATFAPDGTALSIGSVDGVVKFFQVNTLTLEKEISPRCLHQWTPHPQKSLSSLYFLDNHKNHRPDIQFWKFAVTGADNNTELKVWSCETWTCLQTIRIHPNAGDSVMPCLKAEIDLSSKYLFLSDIKRKVLLLLYLEHNPNPSSVIITSVSEYRVPLPVLSLAIGNVTYSKLHSSSGYKNSDDEGDRDQMGDVLNDADETLCKYIIKCFWIQTKTLQSCRILYKPKLLSSLHSAGSMSSLSQDSIVFKDGLSDISVDSRDTSSRSVKDLDISLTKGLCAVDELSIVSQSTSLTLASLPSHISNYPKCTEVLLTPNDFTSPSHSNLSAQNSFSHHEDSVEPVPHLSEAIDSLPVEPSSLQRRKSSQHSATSSPSREVAEILAPTKVLHLDEMVNETVVAIKDVEAESNNLGSFNITGAPGSPRDQQEYHVKEWPLAPDPTKDFRINARNENELPGGHPHFHSNSGETSASPHDVNIKYSALNQSFVDLTHKLDSVIHVLGEQRSEMLSLQNEIKALRQDQMVNQLDAKDDALNKLEHIIIQNSASHHSRIENLFAKMGEEENHRTERELNLLSDEISATFSNKLENTLKQELASKVVPQINTVLDTIAQKMQLDFNQKLATTDASLRDSFTKHFKGKAFMDCLSQTLIISLQGVVQSACKDVFQNNVVPSFDKACHHLFQQLNEQFSKGTSEYVQILEHHANKSSSAVDTMQTHLKEEVNRLVSGAHQAIHAQSVKVENHNLDLVKRQHEVLLSDIRQVMQEEVRRVMREQTTAVLNSRSTTPVPLADPQMQKQQLMQLVNQGNIADAFQQALTAMDVQLVLFLCEAVSLDQVFGPTPCPLQQHVLLSLVNQLSADLTVKTEIKVKYIEDVIASLDSHDPIIKDHIRNVLENLQQRISNFLLKNPTHRLSRNLKRISLAVNALIKC